MKKKHFIQFLMFLNFVLYHLINNAFRKCLRLRKSTWNFWEVNFRSRDFVGFCWKPLGFWGLLIFAPIPSSNLEYPPPTAPPFLFPPPLVSQPNALLDPQEIFIYTSHFCLVLQYKLVIYWSRNQSFGPRSVLQAKFRNKISFFVCLLLHSWGLDPTGL